MKNITKNLLCVIIALIFSFNAKAETMTFGAMAPGSAWYMFGATLSELVKSEIPGAKLDVIARGGGVSNPVSVATKKTTIALSNRATAVWATKGIKPYKKKYNDLRVLIGGINQVRVSPIATRAYVNKTGNDTLEKILNSKKNPPRIIMKPEGSSSPAVADLIFEAMGTSRDKIKKNGGKIIQVGVGQIPSLIKEGKADLYFEVVIPGIPVLKEVTTVNDMKFIDLPSEVVKKLESKGLTSAAIPKKWFKGIDGESAKSVDIGTIIVVNKSMSNELAYKITKSILNNKEKMQKSHKAWSFFKPENGAKKENVGIKMHPGAIKAFKEKGWY
jgi:TRAP transporter TAXI family solute receptor